MMVPPVSELNNSRYSTWADCNTPKVTVTTPGQSRSTLRWSQEKRSCWDLNPGRLTVDAAEEMLGERSGRRRSGKSSPKRQLGIHNFGSPDNDADMNEQQFPNGEPRRTASSQAKSMTHTGTRRMAVARWNGGRARNGGEPALQRWFTFGTNSKTRLAGLFATATTTLSQESLSRGNQYSLVTNVHQRPLDTSKQIGLLFPISLDPLFFRFLPIHFVFLLKH